MVTRLYLPTLADLIDRLTIVTLKSIFIPENKAAYDEEKRLIIHDIDVILSEKRVTGEMIHAACVVMLANRYIWENESKARAGGDEQDKLLKLTHSINGIRNTAKNVIARETGERIDLKIDCLASDLVKEFGDWRIW